MLFGDRGHIGRERLTPGADRLSADCHNRLSCTYFILEQ